MTEAERIAALESLLRNIRTNYNAPHLIDARAAEFAFAAILEDMKERYREPVPPQLQVHSGRHIE